MTSQEWWERTKNNPDKLLAWLHKQYYGEWTAAVRLEKFLEKFQDQIDRSGRLILRTIIAQEKEHSVWILKLLQDRGQELKPIESESRYWTEAEPGITDWTHGCAVAAHAEAMRLERIRVIADDPFAEPDIRNVFIRILPQEEFHERAFRSLTTPEVLEETRAGHERGAAALGLVL